MEFFLEIFLTVVLSLAMAFLFAKVVSKASIEEVEKEESSSNTLLTRSEVEKNSTSGFNGGHVVVEERSVGGELRNKGLEVETQVEFLAEEDHVVDEFVEGEILREGCVLVEVERVGEGGEGEEHVDTVKEELPEEEEEEESKIAKIEENPAVECSSCKEEKKEENKEEEEEEEVEEDDEKEEVKVGLLLPLEPEESFVQESSQKVEVLEMGANLGKDEQVVLVESSEGNRELEIGENSSEGNRELESGTDCQTEKECLFSDDDDDWEGIERSEVEKLFSAASTFVASGDNNGSLSKLGSDVQMQLFGLRKVATEGPCRDPQPMALMVSSRAKWHAWQRLGNMSPEVAMEEYIALLSHNVPGWMVKSLVGNNERDKHSDSPRATLAENQDLNSGSFLHQQLVLENERKPGSPSCGEGGDANYGQ